MSTAEVLLRFWRWIFKRIGELKAIERKTSEDLADILHLEKMLEEPPPEPSRIAQLTSRWQGRITTSGDPVWDSWMAAVDSGKLPDSFWGNLKNTDKRREIEKKHAAKKAGA